MEQLANINTTINTSEPKNLFFIAADFTQIRAIVSIDTPLTYAGEIGKLSEGIPVKSIIFREEEASYDYNFHNAPQKQYLILIDGGIEIETSLGEKRQFQTGQIL